MPQKAPRHTNNIKEQLIKSLLTEFNNQTPQVSHEEALREVIFSWIKGLGIPVIATIITLTIKLRFFNFFSDAPFLLFFIPVLLSSWLAGFTSGIIATLLGAFFIFYIFIPPYWTFHFTVENGIFITLYLLEGMLISYIVANQRKAQANAEAVKLSFQLLLENTTDYGILFFDERGYITEANYGATLLTGYSGEDIKGRHVSTLFTLEDREKKLPEKEFATAIRKNRSTDENYLERKNKTIFFASGFTSPLWTEQHRLYGFVKIFQDVTKGKRLEQEKEDFISIAAHELKNPVSSTSLYLQLLQKYYQEHPNKEAQGYLKKASSQLQRLLDLITTLLDVSQIQKESIQLNKELTDINKLVKDILEIMQPSEKQHKLLQKGQVKTKIMLDKRKIEEVLINLLNNAIKYSPEAQKILIVLKNKRNEVQISVTDYGIGMTKEVAGNVFKRFYRGSGKQTQHIQGLGLGLYISSQIITSHGGKLDVKSVPGKGSTFSFSIPKT